MSSGSRNEPLPLLSSTAQKPFCWQTASASRAKSSASLTWQSYPRRNFFSELSRSGPSDQEAAASGNESAFTKMGQQEMQRWKDYTTDSEKKQNSFESALKEVNGNSEKMGGATIQDQLDQLKEEIARGKSASQKESSIESAVGHQPEQPADGAEIQHTLADEKENLISSIKDETPQAAAVQEKQKSNDEQFEEVLSKYYTEIDQEESDELERQKRVLEEKLQVKNPSQYFQDKSSQYYKINEMNLRDDMKKFQQRVTESFSDYRSHYSDWRYADSGKQRKVDDDQGFKNHQYNKYENYFSGYETTMDMPKAQVAKVFALPFTIAVGCGYYLYKNKRKPKNNECWAKDEDDIALVSNKVVGRTSQIVVPANDPCEDRYQTAQLKYIDGYYAAVFDGHGGWKLADYCKDYLHLYIDEELQKFGTRSPSETQIKEAITKGFDRLECEWLELSRTLWKVGSPKLAYTGACALVSIVQNDKLYVAQTGDCKGTLYREKTDSGFERIKISTTFSANKAYEQKRLQTDFPNEKDAVVCKKFKEPIGTVCRVKGRRMPSRAFGDFDMKHGEFNFHNGTKEQGYRPSYAAGNFSGPYMLYKPDIQVHNLLAEDRFIVLASDGLWDMMNRKESAKVLSAESQKKGGQIDKDDVCSALVDHCFDNYVNQFNKYWKQYFPELKEDHTKESFALIKPGNDRRNLCDDVTVLTIDLRNQIKK